MTTPEVDVAPAVARARSTRSLRRAGTALVGIASLATLVLAPLLLWQARRARRQIIRLPEAAGRRHGHIAGAAPPLRLLLIGDSTVAGVGAKHQGDALGAQMAARVHALGGRAVQWRVQGRNGRRLADVLHVLRQSQHHGVPDIVVVSVGVNDITGLTSARRWRAQIVALVTYIEQQLGGAKIVFSGLPPVHRFPALAAPLRHVLGLRSYFLNRVLHDTVTRWPDVLYVPLVFEQDPSLFAEDGFHPGAKAYATWARELARRILT